ncbi:arsenate reductase (glutaredoxin) [Rhizosaccharibacter radicis]|uniref:arsenate reductase (glutaredoxin) n=1 Tax=Rhizosaccharibacter radicis TaxID=2782605 RepID=UPI003BF56918
MSVRVAGDAGVAGDARGNVRMFHNPRCGTSRRVLELLRERGIEPELVEYLRSPPDRAGMRALLDAMGLRPGGLVRWREPLAAEMGLEQATDEAVLDALLQHPVLMERPVVCTGRGTAVCRPAEKVLDLL